MITSGFVLYWAAYIRTVSPTLSQALMSAPWLMAAYMLCSVPVFTSSKKSVACAYAELRATRTKRATVTTIRFLVCSLQGYHTSSQHPRACEKYS